MQKSLFETGIRIKICDSNINSYIIHERGKSRKLRNFFLFNDINSKETMKISNQYTRNPTILKSTDCRVVCMLISLDISCESQCDEFWSSERSELVQRGFILWRAADILQYEYTDNQIIDLSACIRVFYTIETIVFIVSPAKRKLT